MMDISKTNRVTIIGNPISDNHLYGHRAIGKRVLRYMTARGKAFKVVAQKSARKSLVPLEGEVMVRIWVYFGDKRKRDIHGHLKALIDSMNGILWKDDSQIVGMVVWKDYDKWFPRSVIEAEAYPNSIFERLQK